MLKNTFVFIITLLASCYTSWTSAQTTFPQNGVQEKIVNSYAFKNATIWIDYQTEIKNATLIVKDGLIEAVGTNIAIPKDAYVIDLKNKTIYPSFIDLYSDYGMPIPEKAKPQGWMNMQAKSNKKGAYHWNQAIKPEINAAEIFSANPQQAEELRKQGFGTVVSHYPDGILRGTGTWVSLQQEKENDIILQRNISQNFSFSKGASLQNYPSALMGSIALIRQAYLDADWYQKSKDKAKEVNLSLEAFNTQKNLVSIFEVSDKLNALRADKIGDEFGIQYIIKGQGDEYQKIEAIKATQAAFIIPLQFPEAYDIADPYETSFLGLQELKHWEMAPSNAAALQKANISFSFTAYGLKKQKELLPNLRKAVKYGLPKQEAIKALTFTPAQLLKVQEKAGSLKKGMLANFLITSGDLFADETIMLENWIMGERFVLASSLVTEITGIYDFTVGSQKNMKLHIQRKGDNLDATIQLASDTNKLPTKITLSEKNISLHFSLQKDMKMQYRLNGVIEDKLLKGEGQTPEGNWVKWQATFEKEIAMKKLVADTTVVLGKMLYPFAAYGDEKKIKSEELLIKNATVWTNENEGILTNSDVLVSNGKIVKIGKNLTSTTAKVIDGTNKHLTSGIIDEHSHIAISEGVNEAGQAVTSEVRIGDVVNPEDVNIYRQLAGGVTTAQLLHGSANPIGGQSALIKLKWGATAEQMQIANAPKFIKFALGENVKQGNWGHLHSGRYPQTRMGVEQTFVDAFIRAKEYEKNLKTSKEPVRRDLELEALVEILNNKRFITCHSYVQSEINMLLKVADSLGFKVNTFTHILEGYKVADKMKKHGAGGSTFADWWAYKMEVQDAIPYNAAIMQQVGIVTAINSDDAEMGRRLNQEAAKTVKYGEVKEEEAWKMVTLNPAKLLHLENSIGSIKVGKDADLVIWTDNPLSIYAEVEKTIIEGAIYFDKEKDIQLRKNIAQEKNRITNKMLQAKLKKEMLQKIMPKSQAVWHCGHE